MKPSLFRMLILLVIVLAGTGRIAQAATYTVTTLTDSISGTCAASACTVSQALAAANATAADDLIAFAAGLRGEIAIADTLVVADATTSGKLTVQGRLGNDAQPEILLSGSTTRQVMNVSSGADVSIESLGIVKGFSGRGGGILNDGTLTIARSTLANNEGVLGGGIYNTGTLAIAHSTLANHSGSLGGGIYNTGTLTITHSRLSENRAIAGAGIYSQLGLVTITRSTLSNNTANASGLSPGLGGGIVNEATLNLAHSTLAGNSASTSGGGIYNTSASATLNLAHSTLMGNSAGVSGGGIRSDDRGLATITASVLAGSLSGGDCSAGSGTANASQSLIQDGQGCGSANNLAGDPRLGPLQDNGGATFTHLPQPGSRLIDAVPCDLLPGFDNQTDQRDIARPQGARCDIGAVERMRGDAAIRKTVTHSLVLMDGTGDGARFEILVQNLGDDPILQAHVQDLLPDLFTATLWDCRGINGGTCESSKGWNDIDQHVDLPVRGSVLYTLTTRVLPMPDQGVVNTAVVDAAGDANSGNNTDSARYQRCGTANVQTDPNDSTLLPYPSTCIFLDGFDMP